ncbi:hypothetical protein SKUN_001194 [Spiroplasma kunkelii CR2-3x]|uniref:Uncharacterized protein n=1 Tax=Spiroplasma kunkelii CR2-3x TaxID=273035 RepID=A0A0K2JHK1_SPIKU|nr:hypothetical protein SKUN_001194 [Spiroplasma kunkelii CR2-3x]
MTPKIWYVNNKLSNKNKLIINNEKIIFYKTCLVVIFKFKKTKLSTLVNFNFSFKYKFT